MTIPLVVPFDCQLSFTSQLSIKEALHDLQELRSLIVHDYMASFLELENAGLASIELTVLLDNGFSPEVGCEEVLVTKSVGDGESAIWTTEAIVSSHRVTKIGGNVERKLLSVVEHTMSLEAFGPVLLVRNYGFRWLLGCLKNWINSLSNFTPNDILKTIWLRMNLMKDMLTTCESRFHFVHFLFGVSSPGSIEHLEGIIRIISLFIIALSTGWTDQEKTLDSVWILRGVK